MSESLSYVMTYLRRDKFVANRLSHQQCQLLCYTTFMKNKGCSEGLDIKFENCDNSEDLCTILKV